VTRWWGVALLALSVGLNAGLGVAVLQQRFLPAAPPPASEPPLPDGPAGWMRPVEEPGPGQPGKAASSGDGAAAARTDAGDVATGTGDAVPPAASAPRAAASHAPVASSDSLSSAAPPAPAATAPPSPEPVEDLEPSELAWVPPDDPAGGFAGRPGSPRRRPGERFLAMPPEQRLEEMAVRLGVPPEDRPRFARLQREFFGETRDGRMRLDGVRRQLRAELTAARPDRARIDELLAQSGELQAGLERALVEHVLAAREVLDGEAERRYLHFLSRLGAAGGGPGGARQGAPPRRRPGLRPGRPPF
jgi:hypothetical protein